MWMILLILLVPYLLLLAIYRIWWQRNEKKQTENREKQYHRFSILIPARNEAENIEKCLQSIAAIDYPSAYFEIIVIDDFSTDATAEIVSNVSGVRLIRLSESVSSPINSYKKKAIETGVAAAKFPWIVTTDADCTVPKNWLIHFNRILQQEQIQFIAAPVAIQYGKAFLDVFQALDFMSLQGITGAAASTGFHHMCNGANLCYSKHAFEAVEGFRNIDHIASGDDMLLMQKIAQKFPKSIAYCKNKEAIVRTLPVIGIKAFFMQRIRWASKARSYKDARIITVLLLVYLLNAFLVFVFLMAFLNASLWPVLIAGILTKCIGELIFLLPVAEFFGMTALLLWFPFAQPFHIVYTVVAGALGSIGKYEWKQRKVQ